MRSFPSPANGKPSFARRRARRSGSASSTSGKMRSIQGGKRYAGIHKRNCLMKTDPTCLHLAIRDCQGVSALPRSHERDTLSRFGWGRSSFAYPFMHRLRGWVVIACCGVCFGEAQIEAKPRPYIGHAYARPNRVQRPVGQRVPVVTYHPRVQAAPRSPHPSMEGYTGRRRAPLVRYSSESSVVRTEPAPRLRFDPFPPAKSSTRGTWPQRLTPVQGRSASSKHTESAKKASPANKSPAPAVKSREAEPAPPEHLPPELPFAPDKEPSAAVSSKSPGSISPTSKPDAAKGGGDYDHLPVATPVPGKAGFVTLPGNHAGLPEIDVRGIDSGTAAEIPDPSIPGSTIQFRVP